MADLARRPERPGQAARCHLRFHHPVQAVTRPPVARRSIMPFAKGSRGHRAGAVRLLIVAEKDGNVAFPDAALKP